MNKKILFVDDEVQVLNGIRRLMFALEDNWETDFAISGEEAVTKLAQEHYDIIVSDMRMPGMSGNDLLRHVSEKYPHMVRIILSGQSDQDMILKTVQPTHQFLTKPCDSATLREILNRSLSLCQLLKNPKLVAVTAKLTSLPSLPSLYQEIMTEMQKTEFSMQRIGEIISKDVAMTAKILQLVNSSFFGLAVNVTDPTHAVKLLGAEIIKGLVISAQIFSQFDALQCKHISIENFTKHSLAVGMLAKQIAETEDQDKRTINECMLAGMLHDTGQLILAQNLPDEYEHAINIAKMNKLADWQSEKEIIGSSHAEVGAYLVGLWGLSQTIVDALTFHHEPQRHNLKTFSPLTAVYVANCLVNEQPYDEDYVQSLGLNGHKDKFMDLTTNYNPMRH